MNKKQAFNRLKYSIILLIFFFITRYLLINFNTINFNDLKFNYIFLGVSVIVYSTHIVLNSVIWYFITKQNNCNIGFFETIKVKIYSDLGKYIPGKVFAYGILFYSYDQKGISKKSIAVCSFQELVAGTLAAIIIALVSIYFADIEILNRYRIIFIGLAFACLIMIHPGILKFISNKLLKLLKKEPITSTSSYLQILLVLVMYFINWLVFGLAFYFFIGSFYPFSFENYFFITGAFSIAGLIGFIAVFAPAGLGVREGVLVFTLSMIFPSAIAAIISLISRLWMTICELLVLFIVFVTSYLKNRKNSTRRIDFL